MEAIPFPTTVSEARYTFGDITLPLIDVSAARGEDGRVILALVNTDPHRAVTVRTNLPGRSASGRILVSDRMDAHNSFDEPNAPTPQSFSGSVQNGMVVVEMPPMGVAVLAVD
jgi:alpha-N-arabinofuranosidase